MKMKGALTMVNKKPIYGLVCGIPSQAKIIENHCFRTCKKIIPGAMIDQELGEIGVCRTAKEDCPRIDKEMDEPFGEVMGEPVILRKLK